MFNETADAEWWAARDEERPTIYDAGLHRAWDWDSSPAKLARKAHGKLPVNLVCLLSTGDCAAA